MRINTVFDVFLYGSHALQQNGQTSVATAPRGQFCGGVVAPCHAAQAITSSCAERWQSSV